MADRRRSPRRSKGTIMKTYLLQREIATDDPYDVVVAGGGPAGTAAAICAGRQGAKVLLVEATGCLGGMATSGLVSQWSALSAGTHSVIGGLMLEIVKTMHQRGHLPPHVTPEAWTTRFCGSTGFEPEGLKILLDDLCVEAGVEVRFFTRVIDAEADREARRVDGFILHNVEGCRFVPARAFVDATGDAIVADLCGADCREAGRDTPHIMPPTLCCLQTGIDFDRLGDHEKAVFKAIKDGFFSQPDRHVPGLFRTGRTTAIMNSGHLFGMNALNCRSLSDGMIKGRKLAREYTAFCRKYLSGCENMLPATTASLMGVRESRRIVGEYELCYDDFKARRHFPDNIAVYCKKVDIHVYDCSDEQYERYLKEFRETDTLGFGETYGLPYRILVPKGWRNLWVAGRCNSSDLKVHGAIRDQPACFMMGQAAGVAAVQSIRTQTPAFALDTQELVSTLRRCGAYLPEPAEK